MIYKVFEPSLADGEHGEFVIFAQSENRAEQLLQVFKSVQENLSWHPEEWEAFGIAGSEEQMGAALATGREGLGKYVPDVGWIIMSPPAC